MSNIAGKSWDIELESKPDFMASMERIYAWYEGEIIDRPPVRFSSHNADFEEPLQDELLRWATLEDRWFDHEFQVDAFIRSIEGKSFHGETFPVLWPNLGPNVFAAFYGAPLEFGEVTSWAEPIISTYEKIKDLKLDWSSPYFRKIEEITHHALERCQGRFIVGYTDLHPGLDCAAALRGTEPLCMDLMDCPDEVKKLIDACIRDFQSVYDHFDTMIKKHRQVSVTWMGIPSFGKMHIPSCDFSAMLSPSQYEEFCLPVLEREVKSMDHNIYHLDGKDASRHLDLILNVPEVQAIQWVPGVGDDQPIMQWVPLLKRMRQGGKSVVIDLTVSELEDLISSMPPDGLYLCIPSDDEDEQKAVLERVERW